MVSYIVDRTGLTEGEVSIVLEELCDAIIFYNLQGQGAKIEGLGTYLPKVGLDGTFGVSHRLDKAIKNGLNAPGAFSGEIVKRENAFLLHRRTARAPTIWWRCGTRRISTIRWRSRVEPGSL